MIMGNSCILLITSDLVMWNCDQQEEPTVLEGIHDGICGDFFIRTENEQ